MRLGSLMIIVSVHSSDEGVDRSDRLSSNPLHFERLRRGSIWHCATSPKNGRIPRSLGNWLQPNLPFDLVKDSFAVEI
jgi:hypothetical protein